MKDFDLESKLKALRVPERGEDFWEAFPQRVMGELRRAPAEQSLLRAFAPRLAWAASMAMACLVAGLCLGASRMPRQVCHALVKDENELRQTVRQFPGHVRALMLDEHGLHNLVEDQP
jgi:hypothetical protein